MARLIQDSMPAGLTVFRVHVSGDFYNERYFLAWLNVSLNNPYITFYGYTKAIPYLVKYKKYIPANFRFTASTGGTHDHLIKKHKLVYADTVFSVNEARMKGLEIDHDDSHALQNDKPFALLLHGCQPQGTVAAWAWMILKDKGLGGYWSDRAKSLVVQEKPFTLKIDNHNGRFVFPKKELLTTSR